MGPDCSRTARIKELSEMQRMHQYEADLRHGVPGNREKGEAMGVRSHPVLLEQLQTSPQVGHVRSVDPELLDNEDKLGCARGVMWAIVFEAAMMIAGVILWNLRFSLR
jgi:hypothetical protein